MWDYSHDHFDTLIAGRIPRTNWTEYKEVEDIELMPRVNLTYRWWSSDRFGIIKQFRFWKSANGNQIEISSSFPQVFRKTDTGKRSEFAERLEVRVQKGSKAVQNAFNGAYYHIVPSITYDTFFNKNLGVPIDIKNKSKGLTYDGPFQLTMIDGKTKEKFHPIVR